MNLDNDVPLIDAPAPKKRGRKPAVKTIDNPAARLIAALKWIKPAQEKAGPVPIRHCMMFPGWLVATNGVMTIGTPIEEQLYAFPNTFRLLAALEQATTGLAISQASEFQIDIQSGDFEDHIPCVSSFPIPTPDPVVMPVTDVLAQAIGYGMAYAVDNAPDAAIASVMVRTNTAVSTNRHAAIEAWHGFTMPPSGMLLPQQTALAVKQAQGLKVLSGLGYSGPTATFHYADGSFIHSALYAGDYPISVDMLNAADPTNMSPTPKDFKNVVRAIAEFSEDGKILFSNENVYSSVQNVELAASFKIKGLTVEMGFNTKYLTPVLWAMDKLSFDEATNSLYFFQSAGVRGVIKCLTKTDS